MQQATKKTNVAIKKYSIASQDGTKICKIDHVNCLLEKLPRHVTDGIKYKWRREEHLIVGVIFLKIVVLCLNDYLFAKRGRTRRDID